MRRLFKPSNRSLIRELVVSDFRLRYQNSVLGYLWSLLRPLMLFGVLYVVFTVVFPLGQSIPNYPTYLLLGLVMWTFFVESTISGLNAITGRGDMVRKVSIPKYVIVVSTTISAFVNLCLNMVIVAIFMFIGHVELQPNAILLPFILGELILLCLGISFLLSALYVRFRDLSHIWDVVLQLMFYATPIIYTMDRVSPKYAKILALNPVMQIIQDARSVLITPATVTTVEIFNSQLARIVSVAVVLVLLVVAGLYFRRHSKYFAEEL